MWPMVQKAECVFQPLPANSLSGVDWARMHCYERDSFLLMLLPNVKEETYGKQKALWEFPS